MLSSFLETPISPSCYLVTHFKNCIPILALSLPSKTVEGTDTLWKSNMARDNLPHIHLLIYVYTHHVYVVVFPIQNRISQRQIRLWLDHPVRDRAPTNGRFAPFTRTRAKTHVGIYHTKYISKGFTWVVKHEEHFSSLQLLSDCDDAAGHQTRFSVEYPPWSKVSVHSRVGMFLPCFRKRSTYD